MTLYPNIIYHPDTDTTIFIDTLQEFNTPASSELVTYQSAVDGTINTFERETLARTMSLSGKIGSDNVDTLRRQLQYLRGKQVYLMLGARNLATLAKIRSFDMPVSVGTYTPLALDVVCEGSSEGQFWEAEDCTTDGTDHSQTIASGGKCVYLNSGGESVQIRIEQSDIVLPLGNYKMFARVYDANNVTDDFALNVFNDDDTSMVDSTTVTLTSAYETYAIVTADFEITSDEEGDDLIIYVKKNTGTSNIIYVDFLGFVRTD
jgi:hypothetical protein